MPASVHSQEDQSMMEAEPENVDPIMLDEKRVVVVSVHFYELGHSLHCSALLSIAQPSIAQAKLSNQFQLQPQLQLQFQYTNFYPSTQLPGSSETSASFQFEGEGHTMGNALRYAIMKKWVGLYLYPAGVA